MVLIHGRSEWKFPGWAGRTYSWPDRNRTEFMIHYEGGVPTRDTGATAMRAIDRVHRGRGWAGIGYHFVVMLDGTVWEGRGWSLVGAHCTNHNRAGWGVQVHLGGNQQPTDAALHSANALYQLACQRAGHKLKIMGHRDGKATDCPGDLLEKWVRAGMPDPGVPDHHPIPGIPAPAFPLPAGRYFGPAGPPRSVPGPSKGLERWQTRMHARGWDLIADGLYGPETAGVARHFQREKHLHVDGLIGPITWKAAWEEPIT